MSGGWHVWGDDIAMISACLCQLYSCLFFECLTQVRFSIFSLCFEINHRDQGSETLQIHNRVDIKDGCLCTGFAARITAG